MDDPDAPADGCDIDLDDPATNTADDDLTALALFADIDFTDPQTVVQREREWMELLA